MFRVIPSRRAIRLTLLAAAAIALAAPAYPRLSLPLSALPVGAALESPESPASLDAPDAPDAPAAPSQNQDPPARYSEAIVLSGSDLPGLVGQPVDAIAAIARPGGPRLLLQIDERDAEGLIVESEDGVFDADDLLVLLVEDLEPGEWPAEVSPPIQPAHTVHTTDPLGGPEGFIYLGILDPAAPFAPEPPARMRYEPAEGRIASSSYAVDFAQPSQDGFVGPKALRFSPAGPNLIDRLKIRFTVRILFTATVYTEEDIAADPDVQAAEGPPPRIGPLRIVIGADGVNAALPGRMTMIRGAYEEVDLPFGTTLEDLRIALDLSPAALGASYHDSNTAEPFAIDEKPERGPERLPTWRELHFAQGRLVLLPKQGSTESSARQTWDDGGTVPGTDTGDKRLIGQVGVRAAGTIPLGQADFPGEMVFLPADHPLTAEQLAAQVAAPLRVEVMSWQPGEVGTPTPEPSMTPTPSPTAEPGTQEPTPTRVGTAVATGTATVDGRARVYLPVGWR